jgi:hypothetical protein
MGAALARMPIGELLERAQHRPDRVADPRVTADQVGIGVGETDAGPIDRPAAQQVEIDGAAAKKRLVIGVDRHGVVAAQCRQQLALAPHPLEKGA